MSSPKKWVVYGSQTVVGRALLDILRQKQVTVVAVQETLTSPDDDNVRYVQGDAMRADAVRTICNGAQVILCTIELHFSTRLWAERWPIILANLTATAKEEGAIFGFVDDLYALGPRRVDIHTPLVHPGIHQKPAIRAALRQQLLLSGATFVCVAANNLFGPRAVTPPLGRIGAGRIINGEAPFIFCSADRRHDMAYVPDVARALLSVVEHALVDTNDVVGRFWIAPHAIKGQTLREVTRDMSIIVDRPNVANKVITIPSFVIHVFAACNPLLAEMKDVMPWFSNDYAVCDSDFCQHFKMQPTSYNQALTDTMRWFEEERQSKNDG